jgi:hypothetical protein
MLIFHFKFTNYVEKKSLNKINSKTLISTIVKYATKFLNVRLKFINKNTSIFFMNDRKRNRCDIDCTNK